jgi:hypothetical protein
MKIRVQQVFNLSKKLDFQKAPELGSLSRKNYPTNGVVADTHNTFPPGLFLCEPDIRWGEVFLLRLGKGIISVEQKNLRPPPTASHTTPLDGDTLASPELAGVVGNRRRDIFPLPTHVLRRRRASAARSILVDS